MLQIRARRLLRYCAAAVCLVAAGAGSQAQDVPQVLVSVSGQVTTERGQIIPSGVSVIVEGANGMTIAQQSADSRGRFQVDNLPSGRKPYQLTVKAEGYYPFQQSLDLRAATGTVTVDVVLTRVSKTKQADESLPALTDLSAPSQARKAFEKGVRALEARHLPDAQRDFSAAVADYPCYARAQSGLAAILIAKRDLGAAEAALRQAIQCDPGFPDAFASLGRVLNSEKRFTESETALQQGLRLSPKRWELYDELASAHYNLGLYSEATKEWLQVEALNPEAPSELHAKLAAAYLQQGDPERAYAEMQAYVRAEPDGHFATQARNLMRQIESSGAVHSATNQVTQPEAQKP
ncbi:MAG TPA: tetratricopeptide repeat protein [Terriglobales bacterium]